MEALGSPMAASAIWPPLRIRAGLTPKNAGFQSTMSAHLPTAIEPTSWLMPCAMAGVMGDVGFLGVVGVVGEVVVGGVVVCPWAGGGWRARPLARGGGGQPAALLFHLVRGLPGAQDDFADAAHGLAVAAH